MQSNDSLKPGKQALPCPHGRRISRCKQCGGGSICAHGRIKSRCKECGGFELCPHDKVKSRCKECGGFELCPHDKVKSDCKVCGTYRKCPHGKRKSICKDCGGSSICDHNRRICDSDCGDCRRLKLVETCKKCEYPYTPAFLKSESDGSCTLKLCPFCRGLED
jgi:hypothetical protein